MARIGKTKKGHLVDFYLDGKRVRKVLPTREAAKQHIADETTKTTQEKYLGVKPEEFETFGELVAWYLEYPEVVRKKGYDLELWRIEQLKERFGEMALKKISPEDIHAYMNSLLTTPTRRGTLNKPATVNRTVAVLKHMFNLAEELGKTRYNPGKGKRVRLLGGEEERDRYLTEEEWEAYYREAPDWYRPFALCLYTTGMRLGEVRELQWDRVDRKAGFIRLKAYDTKTSKARKIPIDPRLEEVFQTLPRSLSGYVFTRKGKKLNNVHYCHGKICREAEIRDFRIHDFRHTAVKNWVDSGANIFTVQAASGHKTLDMLRRYYTVTDDDLRAMTARNMVRIRSELQVEAQ